MNTLIDILLIVGICYAGYKVVNILVEILLNKYFPRNQPGTTDRKETDQRVSAEVQNDIVAVLNKHKCTDEQILSALIYLSGVSVVATGSKTVYVTDHARNLRYTITVEDA